MAGRPCSLCLLDDKMVFIVDWFGSGVDDVGDSYEFVIVFTSRESQTESPWYFSILILLSENCTQKMLMMMMTGQIPLSQSEVQELQGHITACAVATICCISDVL